MGNFEAESSRPLRTFLTPLWGGFLPPRRFTCVHPSSSPLHGQGGRKVNTHFSDAPTRAGSWEGSGNGSPPRWAEDRPGSGSQPGPALTPREALWPRVPEAAAPALSFLPSRLPARLRSFPFFGLFPHYACFLFLSSPVLVELLPVPLASLLLFFLPFILFFYCFSIASIIDSFFKVNFIGVYRSVHTGHQAKH